jgi:UDP-N-acetylglucosamine 4,6-dehydratase
MLKNKNILITGGTGSFGKNFIQTILKNHKPKKIIIYSRDEQKHFQLQNKWKNYKNLRFLIGDVRDFKRLSFAMEDIDIVIHAAAMKHVPQGEYNPFEVVKTNILGAQNVIEASLSKNVKKVIALSTDKASSPINLYGASKLTSDKLFIAANNYKGKKDIKFSVVRYGNVLGSEGSVLPFFLKCKQTNIFPITDHRMTRFNITIKESINFILFCLHKMLGGELFVPKIPSFRVTDLAKAVSDKAKLKFIGIRSGEKMHEEMISISESFNSISYKDHFVIAPNSEYLHWNKNQYLKKFKGGSLCPENFTYNSLNNKNYLSIVQLRKIIKEFQKKNIKI